MNLPKRDAKGRFMSSNTNKSENLQKNNEKLDLIAMANTIKKQNDEINRLNREVNFWRITSAVFAVSSLILFFAYFKMCF